jgi:uncharacterized protein YdiU (UPF0061 family)
MTLDTLRLESPYIELEESFYERREATPLDKPYLISLSLDALKLLGLDDELNHEEAVINGDVRLQGSKPFAMAYAGHQFGNYNPWLGDGRAINLGKALGWNIQLKDKSFSSIRLSFSLGYRPNTYRKSCLYLA